MAGQIFPNGEVVANDTWLVDVGRGDWLRHETLHAPLAVGQLGDIDPPFVVNATTVSSGTGLLNASAMRIVAVLKMPSYFQAVGAKSLNDKLMLFWSGIPVDTAKELDWVLNPFAVVAVTRTAVATVPACTVVVA